ncbi:MAG: choice-of-anchor X domain-containing protein, partial [Nanoarchaeota archaeon]
SQLILYDDGNHNDTNARDGIYGNNFLDTLLEGVYIIDAGAFIPGIFQIQDKKVVFIELNPDLEIKESDIIFDSPSLIPGQNQTVNISATIRNIGKKDAENVSVKFYNGNPAFGGIFVNSTINVPANSSYTLTSQLNYIFSPYPYLVIQGSPNTSSTVNISIIDPAFENYDIYVTISSFSNFTESNYSNNIAHRNLNFQDTYYVLAISLGTSPGILLPDNRTIPLNFDGAFILSVFYPNLFGLQNSQGILDNNGEALATWTIPSYAIPGITVHFAFVSINPALIVPQAILGISNPVAVTII